MATREGLNFTDIASGVGQLERLAVPDPIGTVGLPVGESFGFATDVAKRSGITRTAEDLKIARLHHACERHEGSLLEEVGDPSLAYLHFQESAACEEAFRNQP